MSQRQILLQPISKGKKRLDKITQDMLLLFGEKEGQMLTQLAQAEGRSVIEQMRFMIRARWTGRYKDLGDDRIDPRLFLNEILFDLGNLNGPGGYGGAGRPGPKAGE